MKTKKIWLTGVAFFMLLFTVAAQTTTVNGLVVVVNFKDYKLKATMAELEDMFNQPTGFNLWGNEASVREYYRVQTNNKIDLVNTIISVDLDQNSDYYVGKGAPGDLAIDVIAAVNQKYPAGFSGLTAQPGSGRLYNFSMISQSAKGAGVAWGTQGSILNNGVSMPIANVLHVSWVTDYAYDINTVCHEYGHNIWEWADYYKTAASNLGMFDLMASAGTNKLPMPINPALRNQRGWIDTVTNIPGNVTATYSVQANNYSRMFRYVNPMNPQEYLVFQALKHDKYYQADIYGTPTPEGLAIWYVDEGSGFGPFGGGPYLIKLVQADNLDQMHDEDATGHVRGDMNDLYGNGNNSFPNGHPLKWKDGGELGIIISNIVKSGNYVNFTVNTRTKTVLAMSDLHGTLSPKGVLNITNGSSQSFTFIPNPGYELVDLLVDDQSVPVSNPYTLTGIGTTIRTIQPFFVKKANLPALPSPWQKAHIGINGLAVHDSGKFSLESEGGVINGSADHFTYVYQTINGNGTIIARVADWNTQNNGFKAGIMIRESLQNNSVQTLLAKTPNSGHTVGQRTATGSNIQNDPNDMGNLHAYNLYNWLKITRTGNEFISYCSRDGINWVPLAQQTINMPNQVMFGLCVTGGLQYVPARASFDNVSVNNVGDLACSFSGAKVSGTSIGTEGSWNNSGATRDKVFDGSIFTDFDAPTGAAWTGLSLDSGYRITGIRFFPRKGSMDRMVGGKFQGSNTADFSSGVVDLGTITTEPAYGWNCISVTNTSSFAYIRYLGPNEGHGNVSEIEFYGDVQAANQQPTVSFISPVHNSTHAAPATLSLSASASDTDGSIWRVEFFNGNTLVGTDYAAPYQYTVFGLAAGTYSIKAVAYDDQDLASEPAISTVNVTNGNSAPTVSITSPLSNSSFAAPATITINTEVEDVDDNIWKVEFYSGSTLLGSDFTAPYSYTWNNVPAGVYNITALAIDNENATASSTRNNIAVIANQAPEVSIVTPVTNQSFNAPATINIDVTATDADGSITKVDFYYGTTLLGSDLTAPYSYTWNNVPAGVYNITALAIDNMGASASSTRNNIAVIANQAPTVSITSPASNAGFVAPANIAIAATAADADGSIWKVEFYNGSTFLNSDFTAPYSYTWSNVTAGTYSITARAIDNAGAYTEYTVSNITVTASTADITGPACVSNNTTVTYEVSPAKRVGATNYGWYFTGSTQSFNPSSTTPYQVSMTAGSNFGSGQLCVGVGYNVAPWHTTYCITVPKCTLTREADVTDVLETELVTAHSYSFPNPFNGETTISLATQSAKIQIYNANGQLVEEAVASGLYTFGSKLNSGIYFVRINSEGKSETLKVVKE